MGDYLITNLNLKLNVSYYNLYEHNKVKHTCVEYTLVFAFQHIQFEI